MANPPWFQDLIPAAFRGVPFKIVSHEKKGGRRGPDHEYPDSDVGKPEDTGGMLDRDSIDAYIVGDEYHIAADLLIQALKVKGPGTLDHPRYGTRRVQVRGWSRKEDNAEGGIARFQIDFVDAPENGGLTINIFADVETDADETITAASATFAANYNTIGVSGPVGDSALASATGLYARVNKALRRDLAAAEDALALVAVIPTFATQIADPPLLASTLAEIWKVSPFAALRDFTAARPADKTTTGTDPNEALIIANDNALEALAQRLALAEYARQAVPLVEDTFSVYDDAIAIRDELDARVRVEEGTDNASEYESLISMRTDAHQRISDAAEALVRLRTITLTKLTSALVLAYDLYSDATRAVEIIDRNGIRNGAFMIPGTELSVLAE